MKCSQPLLGNNNKRSKEDELYLKSVLPNNKKGYIYDLRDVNIMKLAARSNQGGYETDHSYPLWKLVNRHSLTFKYSATRLRHPFSRL
jgi:hypothetical protein